MLYYYLLYFFIAFGAKVLLAMLMIYLLLPNDGVCGECDGDTLLIRPGALGRLASRIAMGRVQWRWCARCGREGLARRTPRPPHHPAVRAHRRPRTPR